jgi:hypothetical protein
MQKTHIAPEILQPFFESAANAAAKGQSAFYTPYPFGRQITGPLPAVRPTIVDLNCGAGHLLQASAGTDTATLLGADIDPCRGQSVEGATLHVNRITSDACLLYVRPDKPRGRPARSSAAREPSAPGGAWHSHTPARRPIAGGTARRSRPSPSLVPSTPSLP